MPPAPATGFRRLLFLWGGCACVGMGYVGAIVPGIPTTPWLLLASYCFARSSPRLQAWLLRSPVFGKLLRDWHEHRGIRRPVKRLAVAMAALACGFSIVVAPTPLWLKCVIAACGVVGVAVIVWVVPTIEDEGVNG